MLIRWKGAAKHASIHRDDPVKQPRVFVQVSIVSQEPVLFADSIMHNIAFGMPGGSSSVSLAMVGSSATHPSLAASPPCVLCLASRPWLAGWSQKVKQAWLFQKCRLSSALLT